MYFLDNEDQIADYWVRLFEAISIRQFAEFSDILQFPLRFNDEISGIAKDFVLAYLSYLGRNPPEKPSVAMYDLSIEKPPPTQIWDNTFLRASALGIANEIYLWGRWDYELETNSRSPLFDVSDWDLLLIDWAYDPTNPGFKSLEIPIEVIGKLELVVKKHYEYSQQVRFQIDTMGKMVDNAWESYVFSELHTQAWIANRVRRSIQLSKWKAVFSLLTDHQLNVLDLWGYSLFSRNNGAGYFSLVQLKNELSKAE